MKKTEINWKQDLPEFREKQLHFMQEKWTREHIRDFPAIMEAMPRKAEQPACCGSE